ncbi:MAG TPA: ATP-binding cassette domain-containing protein, partial [Candidatus Binataceae bacterium]|nr:ATP-binding cassette domain-containing protein [Candidatus Binataceae bacterium]
ARLMIGELITVPESKPPAGVGSTTLLEIENLTYRNSGVTILDGISLKLNAGEIAGIAGVDGNGQTELVEALAGGEELGEGLRTPFSFVLELVRFVPGVGFFVRLLKLLDLLFELFPAGSGARRVSAGTFQLAGGAAENSMAVIPQDRDLDGLILDMQLWENLLLAKPLRARVSRNGWIDVAGARDLCRDVLASFRIRASGPEAKASSLSGGNRQRLEVARAMTQKPRVLVAHNVTRGLDLAATAEVHRILVKFAADGGAVLLVSSDLDELLAIATRLFVISRGKIRETDPRDRSPEKLGLMMAGRG